MKTTDLLFWASCLVIYLIIVVIIVIFFFGRGRSFRDDDIDR